MQNKEINKLFNKNNKMYNKSIIEVYLKNGHVPEGHVRRRLNLNYKRSIRHSPYEKVYGYNFLDLYEERIIEYNEVREIQNVCPRKQKNLVEKDTVYIKRFNVGKLEEQYEGPYVVTKVGPKGLWFKTNKDEGWVHVRDLK